MHNAYIHTHIHTYIPIDRFVSSFSSTPSSPPLRSSLSLRLLLLFTGGATPHCTAPCRPTPCHVVRLVLSNEKRRKVCSPAALFSSALFFFDRQPAFAKATQTSSLLDRTFASSLPLSVNFSSFFSSSFYLLPLVRFLFFSRLSFASRLFPRESQKNRKILFARFGRTLIVSPDLSVTFRLWLKEALLLEHLYFFDCFTFRSLHLSVPSCSAYYERTLLKFPFVKICCSPRSMFLNPFPASPFPFQFSYFSRESEEHEATAAAAAPYENV